MRADSPGEGPSRLSETSNSSKGKGGAAPDVSGSPGTVSEGDARYKKKRGGLLSGFKGLFRLKKKSGKSNKDGLSHSRASLPVAFSPEGDRRVGRVMGGGIHSDTDEGLSDHSPSFSNRELNRRSRGSLESSSEDGYHSRQGASNESLDLDSVVSSTLDSATALNRVRIRPRGRQPSTRLLQKLDEEPGYLNHSAYTAPAHVVNQQKIQSDRKSAQSDRKVAVNKAMSSPHTSRDDSTSVMENDTGPDSEREPIFLPATTGLTTSASDEPVQVAPAVIRPKVAIPVVTSSDLQKRLTPRKYKPSDRHTFSGDLELERALKIRQEKSEAKAVEATPVADTSAEARMTQSELSSGDVSDTRRTIWGPRVTPRAGNSRTLSVSPLRAADVTTKSSDSDQSATKPVAFTKQPPSSGIPRLETRSRVESEPTPVVRSNASFESEATAGSTGLRVPHASRQIKSATEIPTAGCVVKPRISSTPPATVTPSGIPQPTVSKLEPPVKLHRPKSPLVADEPAAKLTSRSTNATAAPSVSAKPGSARQVKITHTNSLKDTADQSAVRKKFPAQNNRISVPKLPVPDSDDPRPDWVKMAQRMQKETDGSDNSLNKTADF